MKKSKLGLIILVALFSLSILFVGCGSAEVDETFLHGPMTESVASRTWNLREVNGRREPSDSGTLTFNLISGLGSGTYTVTGTVTAYISSGWSWSLDSDGGIITFRGIGGGGLFDSPTVSAGAERRGNRLILTVGVSTLTFVQA